MKKVRRKVVKPVADRGQIREVTFKEITFNGNTIKKAVIEIDHINFGLDRTTNALNKTKRTNFTVSDIEKFLMMLDGEYIYSDNFRGRVTRFEIKIDCPVAGRFKHRVFIMICETDYDEPEKIHVITLFLDGRYDEI
ncbi:MAG: hypothetical protein IPK68_02935 [Bdellovibrionales bacterium]|nr:hypothetical protein [Bdellovibrionales bacterium]